MSAILVFLSLVSNSDYRAYTMYLRNFSDPRVFNAPAKWELGTGTLGRKKLE